MISKAQRERIYARAGGLCEGRRTLSCERKVPCRSSRLDGIHHIMPRSICPKELCDKDENLALLCKVCHDHILLTWKQIRGSLKAME